MLNINKADIEFLKNLQHVMNTQDTVCQADPRFWVVEGTEREYGIEAGYEDGCEIVTYDGTVIASNMEEAYEYIKENADIPDENLNNLVFDPVLDTIIYTVKDEDETIMFDFDDVIDFLREDEDNMRVANYRNIEKIFPNTMFITNDECKAHIKANYYHYPKDAHSYAMTAWRAPQVERLWKILQTINWDEIETSIMEDKHDRES